MALTPAPDADTLHLDLETRPVCGQDLLFLQQWYKLSRLDMGYLLGLSDLKWYRYTHPQHVEEPLTDPAVALLVWALARYPETLFLPVFPTPREVYPLYQRLAAQSAGGAGGGTPVTLGKTTFSLLLGREIGSASRWLSATHPAPVAATVARLLGVFKNLLQTHGVQGLEDWVECAQIEARERGLDLAGKMTSWFRMEAGPAAPAAEPRPVGRPRGSPPKAAQPAAPPAGVPLAAPPAAPQMDALRGRALRGKDLLFLRQWTGLSIAECCYLLGMPVTRWPYYQKRPDRLIEDAGVALLARALLTHPETHYLPRFPTVAEMEPAYRRALQQSTRALPEPETAFGLLLGRDRASVQRWRTGIGQRRVPGPVQRLLRVLQTLLLHHGVPGFEALVDRAAFEAAARGFDLHAPSMTNWIRRAPYRPSAPGAPRRGRPPKRPPPADAGADAGADEDAADTRPFAKNAPPKAASWLPALPSPAGDPLASPPAAGVEVAELTPAAALPPLAHRPMSGRDVLALQRRLDASFADLCYLLGNPLKPWPAGAAPDDRPLHDPALALLVWALTQFPDLQYLPVFPTPAEVYPLYRDTVDAHAGPVPIRRPATGRAAFSLLLGREIKSTQRWLAETHPEPVPPTLRRLLFAVQRLLQAHGAAGLAAWMRRAGLEARARDLDLAAAHAWPRSTRAVPVPPAPVWETPTDPVAALARWSNGLEDRPVCGLDLRVLGHGLALPTADGAYLFGIGVPKYRAYLEQPARTIDDPAVALLAWALLTYPETRFLTPFPAPAEVYPLFLDAAAHSVRSQPLLRQYRSGTTAFGVLLGRARNRMNRWRSETDPQPVQPPVARLLGVLRPLLHRFGAAGLEAWIAQVRVEAAARGLDPEALRSWESSAAAADAAPTPEPPRLPAPVGAEGKRPRGRPRKWPAADPKPSDPVLQGEETP